MVEKIFKKLGYVKQEKVEAALVILEHEFELCRQRENRYSYEITQYYFDVRRLIHAFKHQLPSWKDTTLGGISI